MFFFLSKTITFLFMPLTVIVVLFIVSLLVRKPKAKKILFWSAFGLLLFFSNDIISNEAMLMWELPTRPYNEVKEYGLGIVLTGTTMTKAFPDDRVYFSKGADRVTHTVELYKMGRLKKILISGGSGRLRPDDEPEANKFKKAMVMMGVDSTDIIIENETRNTYESAVAVKKMLAKMNFTDKDCLLITSAFHMRRSLACYRKAGLNVEHFTTDFYTHKRDYHLDSIVPSIEAINVWQKLIKEWLGFAAYKAAGYV